MQKKFFVMAVVCCIIAGCGKSETITEQENIVSDTVEIQTVMTENSENEEINNAEKSENIVISDEDEMDNSMLSLGEESDLWVSDGQTSDWQDEMYDPWAEANQPLQKKETIYKAEDYGEVYKSGSEFYHEADMLGYYYNIESFSLNSDFLYTMNDTLEKFYDTYECQYQEMENQCLEEGPMELPEGKIPYSELLFQGVEYVDLDYVSLLFNDVTYMGGAHPYSKYDAITIDRHSGKEVSAAEILGESDAQILEKVSSLMGMYEVADWEDIDFYLQKDSIVFFYRMPGYWDEVVVER